MTTPGPGSVGALGEFGLIAAVTARLPQGKGVVLGLGDDAAVVAAPDGRVVVTTDVLVEGRHFRRDWSSATDVGHKAAAQSLADVAAMGARPTVLVVGLATPADLPVAWAVELADGLQGECGPLGVSVVGGDVVRGESIVVSVTALGDLQGRDPLTRSGAQVGDVVAVCGRLGWSAAGMAVLQRGFRSPRVLADAHRRPEPPYAQGVKAAVAGAHAMTDVSDGLLADLGHVAQASGVRIELNASAFEVGEPLVAAGAALGVDPLGWVLTGGEDHALVATFAAGVRRPKGWLIIGAVSEGEDVVVDGEVWPGPAGHDHFA
jgi:thiamine-monophosphate kinase